MSTAICMVSEFEFIHRIKSKYALHRIGDDCAILPKDAESDLLVTADMLVEDIDFRLDWTTPEFLGHKSLAVSLSDIAAMGGTPKWAMLTIGIPQHLWNTDFIGRFYAGWFALATEFVVELVGGDLSKVPDKLVIDSIVGGECAKGKAVLRSTAKPGDAIFVAGTLGGAAGGLRLLQNGIRFDDSLPLEQRDLILKQLQPRPQLTLSKALITLDITTSMLDVSDGLSSDLAHVCSASGVGASIDQSRLPIEPYLASNFSFDECLDMAINGGEDLGLLFTVDEKNISLIDSMPVTRIGSITANAGIIELNHDGKTTILKPKGYRHF
ncbi:MAG TPA: thiamine-phosphate kinase [Pyrinomonadaceae bacterium]|nr:thiamine-phosphate kinase [Pyrinomonadaceae bacterium]